MRLVRMHGAQRVGPALRQQALEGGARLGAEQRIVDPALGLVDVELGRHHVVVARQHHRRAAVDQLGRVHDQALEPVQLVVELRARRRIAVGQVEAGRSARRPPPPRCSGSGIVVGSPGRPRRDFYRRHAARQDGHAVPAFLAVPDGLVAGVAQGRFGEVLLRRLQLLQAGDVGLRFLQPLQQGRQAAVDAVDVEGGDAHGASAKWEHAHSDRRRAGHATRMAGRNDQKFHSLAKNERIFHPRKYADFDEM